jgi:hypothetical protein
MRRLCSTTMGLALAALVGVGAAQNQSGSISGVITDTTGRGLPGATISAVSEDTGLRTVVSDAAGRYRLSGLPPARYLIRASLSGFVARIVERGVVSGSEAVWSGALLVGYAAGETSIEGRVVRFAGPDAIDCGRHGATASESALQRSLQCALTSARAHRPFAVIVQVAGSDPRTGVGLAAASDGRIQRFVYDSGGANFHRDDCAAPAVILRRSRPGPEFDFTCPPPRPAPAF